MQLDVSTMGYEGKRRYIEGCLYGYREDVYKIRELRAEQNELMSVRGQGYDVHRGASIRDPVFEVVKRRERLGERIGRLSKRVACVRRLMRRLSTGGMREAKLYRVLSKRYLERKSSEDMMRELGVSRRTLKRRVRELLREAEECFG